MIFAAAAVMIGFASYGQDVGLPDGPRWVAGKDLLLATEQAGQRLVLIDPARALQAADQIDPVSKAIVWEWSGMTDSSIPAPQRKWFALPSEIKTSADKKTIYFTCSGGAIGAVDVKSRRLRWYTFSGSNPHSIEPLPDGNVATASSNGNFVKIYFTKGRKGYVDSAAFSKVTLTTAHNIIWDAHVSLLWSAGLTEIAGWEYVDGGLREVCRLALPGRDGHDLVRYDDSTLLLSTGDGLWLFHTQTRAFTRYEGCGVYKGVKSISFAGGKDDPHSRIIVVYPNESWWSDRIYNCDGSVFYRMAGARFYKVRFW